MSKLQRADLYSLENYAEIRPAFRAEVLAHKRRRTVHLGEHVTLLFEDRLTIRYQVQEMLRIERIFKPAAIQDELDAYNPLIPDGDNWKVTFMLEYPDPEVRKQKLATLIGIEDTCWVQVEGCEPVRAIADEDLERENEQKTSSVHFLRFQLTPEMVNRAKAGAAISLGIDHPNYRYEVRPLPDAVRKSIVADLA